MSFHLHSFASVLLLLCYFVTTSSHVIGAEDPVAAAQQRAAKQDIRLLAVAVTDPIEAAQILAAANKTFPSLSAELGNAELLKKAAGDPSIRGNLRGRIAEEDWINRNANEGWKKVKNPNAPQNDAFRFLNGRLQGAQVKVHADWRDYMRSMRKDDKAELFVLPDDHFELVKGDLEQRRLGALRGNLVDKAADYKRQQLRLSKLGRTFSELDGSIEASAKHYTRLAKTLRTAGKAASFVGIALQVLDGGIAIYEVATGRIEVDELVTRIGKAAIGGSAAWLIGDAAAAAAIAAGATGAVPVAVAILVGTATYLVVDWGIDAVRDSLRIGQIQPDEITRIWPNGAAGVPVDRLYRKPVDPRLLSK